MKLILEFNLPEEKDEARMAQNAVSYLSALQQIDNDIFRPITKYDASKDEEINALIAKMSKNEKARFIKVVDLMRSQLYAILEENEVNLYE